MSKILIFTDSRGQHKPAGSNHFLFGERLKNEVKDIDIDLVLCPMKWTTTLDFFEYAEKFDLSQYNWIVLYTGVVEWSPRPHESAINDLYNNKNEINTENWSENSRDYSKKIVNNKKKIFDRLFGASEIKKYLSRTFDIKYEDKPTINLYSLQMAKQVVGPLLSSYKNIIFINSNRVVEGWEGDYKRGRPKNISIISEYSHVISGFFPQERLVDISSWTDTQIQKYTCDNMHLTKEGSDWIFNKLIEKMGVDIMNEWEIKKSFFQSVVTHELSDLVNFQNIERFSGEKKNKFLSAYNTNYLATLIIGVRFAEHDPSRVDNLEFLLEWLDYHHSDMFDILIIEQDNSSKFNQTLIKDKKYIRYQFVYNPDDYNRGWGYNVAVKHFCPDSKVVVLMDTDVLTGSNFVAEVRDCLIGKYKIISPYQNIYYTDYEEVTKIRDSMSLKVLRDTTKIKNPVTITGGVVIFDKKTFLELKGFEQYIGYGCEDRALDVMILGLCQKEDIRISPQSYVHLYHPTDKTARKKFQEIYAHLKANYQCEWSGELKKTDFIHGHCEHVTKEALVDLLIGKDQNFANLDLYKNEEELTVNGRVDKTECTIADSLLLPPNFTNFDDYIAKELYEAPDPDTSELAKFRNAFLGKRCFIIGNGPSLNQHDLSLLQDEYTFGVNSFYYKTKETGFRPTFYVVEDSSVMKENLKEIKEYHAPFKFFPTVYKRLHPKTPNTFFFKMNRGFYEKSSPNYCVPRFSTDATKELFCGQSVTYINLQLAYFMGFTEVYLIGMDFSYVIPDSHKRTGDVLLSDSDDMNHFHKDYFGKGKTWKDPKLDRVGMNYRMAKLVFESTGRKVYNATVGGSLEIFERADYSAIFNPKIEAGHFVPPVSLGDFTAANKLFAERRYTDALVIYLHLAENKSDFVAYKEAALNAYFKAKHNKQPIQQEIEERIKKLLK